MVKYQYIWYLSYRLKYHSAPMDTYDISLEHDVWIQMVSNDCKKLQVVYFYVNTPVVIRCCWYKEKQK